jgi:hypothetical protein
LSQTRISTLDRAHGVEEASIVIILLLHHVNTCITRFVLLRLLKRVRIVSHANNNFIQIGGQVEG